MELPLLAGRRGLVAVALIVTLSWPCRRAMRCRGGGGQIRRERAVTIADDGRDWALDNGIVKALVNKRSGEMQSLIYKGWTRWATIKALRQLEQDPSAAAQVNGLTDLVTIDPAKKRRGSGRGVRQGRYRRRDPTQCWRPGGGTIAT